jgi:hypothetical protein
MKFEGADARIDADGVPWEERLPPNYLPDARTSA